jgi:hypothetical protein
MELYGEYDVVVVGGGVSGCATAIASARAGANTLLIEKLGVLGGMMNVSGPPGWAYSHLWNDQGETIIAGLVEETHHRLEKEGHALPYPNPKEANFRSFAFVDPDWWGLLIFQMMTENNVHLLLHSLAVDVVKMGEEVKGVVVENTAGRMAVMGKVIIECTGEGDIAVRAGVPFTKIDRVKEEIDPPSITFHMDGVDWNKATAYIKENYQDIRTEPGVLPVLQQRADFRMSALEEKHWKNRVKHFKKCKCITDLVEAGMLGAITYLKLSQDAVANGDLPPLGVDFGHFFTPREGGVIQAIFQHSAQIPDCDTTDVRELSAGEVEARRQVAVAIKAIRKYLPGYENAYFTRLTSFMRTREGRHMIGDYQLTSTDVAEVRKFNDVIAKSAMGTSVGGPFHSAKKPADGMNRDLNRRYVRPKDGGSYDIPYRSLVPKNVENMLMAGKLVSVSEDFKRDLLPENMATGQAAGVAAAICAKKEMTPRELEKDVSELQTILQEQGAILYTKY